MKLLNIDIRNWLVIGLVLFVIFLMWRPCNKPDEKLARLQAEKKELQKETKQARDSIALIRNQYSTDSAELRGREQLAVIEKNEADNRVKQQQRRIDQLTAIIRADAGPTDTLTDVLVSKEYKEACDSLPAEIDNLKSALAEKDSAIDIWSGVLAYEIQLRDSALEAEQAHSNRLDNLLQRCNKVIEDALKRAKPRGRLLGGVGIMGNQQQFLSGASGSVGYQDRAGKVYLLSGHVMKFPPMLNPQLFGELKVLVKLF